MLRDNVGLVWRKIYMSKLCQFEDVTIIPWYSCTMSSLSSLLAFYGIPIFHTFNFLFTCIFWGDAVDITF